LYHTALVAACICLRCRDDIDATDLIDKAVRNPDGRPKKTVSIRNSKRGKRPVGTTRDHALRHRPDLQARVLAGELSPHRAMIEAGFSARTFQCRRASARR
jgi:hypothetical protein